MTKEEKFGIFICFSTHDAEDIGSHVYGYCKNRLNYDVFFSSKEIRSGDDWIDKRENALKDCDIFLFIATPDTEFSGEVDYEIRRAKELRKKIIPCKDTSIQNWSQFAKKFGLDRIEYVEFKNEHQLIRKLLAEFVLIPQPSIQKDTGQPIGFRKHVKYIQCEFRFKPPNNNGGSSEPLLTKEQFMEKINQQWIESLRGKVIKIDDKSGEKSFDYLLTFPEGEVTISFEGIFSDPQREQDWYARLIVTTDKHELIDWMVKEVERPYWVYRIFLIDKLDVPQISYIESKIKEGTGEEPTGWSTVASNDVLEGKSINYRLGNLGDATVRLRLSGSNRNEDGMIEISMDGNYDEGFYQAHKLLTYDTIFSLIYGEVTPSKKQQIIKDACSKPSD